MKQVKVLSCIHLSVCTHLSVVTTNCTSVQFAKSEGNNSKPVFDSMFLLLQNTSFNSRPVYRQPRGGSQLYLYYYQTTSCDNRQYWTVSVTLGGDNAYLMYTQSTASRVDELTSSTSVLWNAYDPSTTQFYVEASISLQCYNFPDS